MSRSFALLCLLGALPACRSADSWAEEADREVYAILEETRAGLGVDEPFRIEPASDPLRTQLEQETRSGTSSALHLDLVQCLQVAADSSRDWQDQREQLFRAALDLTLQRWNFSVQENGTLGAFLSGTGFQGEKNVGGVVESEGGFLSNLNLFKLLGIGTQITGNIGIDFLRDVGTGDGWDAISHFSLNITQPILKGFGRSIVEEPLTQAERDVLYEARAYERFRRTFSVDIAQRFFRVLERVDRLKNEEANHVNLTSLRERNEALAEAGRLTDIQVDQARQDELTAENRVVVARRDLQAGLDDLKFALGLPIETELVLDEAGQRTLAAWPALEAELPEERVIALGLANRLDHATTRDRLEDAQRGVLVAADALRLGLDLSATAAGTSVEGRPAALHADDVSWLLALDIDLPIDRIPERNVYRDALIEVEASRRATQASADRVTSELRDALRSLDSARASYRIQTGSLTLAERRIESAALNLDAGRASTRDVLEAQDSLLQAQNTLAAALTDTILAGLFLYRDMELLEITQAGLAMPSQLPEEAHP